MRTVTIRLTTGDFEYLTQEARRLRLGLASVIRLKLAEVIGNPTSGIGEMLSDGMSGAGK